MLLQHCTWPDVEAYLETTRGIVIPIGSTEQHGPTGLLGVDAICAEAIAVAVGERCGALVGPSIGVGMALHHLGFPGTVALRPSTLQAVIRDYVLSLAGHGFTRFYFVNGHGGNVPSLQAAFAELYHEARLRASPAPDLRCLWVDWWKQPAVAALEHELFGDQDGIHATAGEISLTLYLVPAAVAAAARPLVPEVAPSGPIYGAFDFRRRYPDGRVGSNPTLASPEHGRRLFDSAVAAIGDAYRAFVDAP